MIDMHMHSNASDGTDSPEQLLRNVQEAGINIFALTDHDTITGAMKMSGMIPEGIKFVRGIEFSCITLSRRKCHILGLNYDPENEAFMSALKAGEDLRHEKFFRRIDILRERFSITFTDEEIAHLLTIPSVGKPHLANMIVAKGFADNRADAIERYIDQCRTGNDKIDAEQAINAINISGGISVWAHPIGGEREPELPEDKFTDTLNELISYGLKGLECWYSKYEYAKCERLEDTAKRKGLYVSGGSDYHGANKSIPLGKLNAENIKIPDERLTIIRGVN